MTHEEAKAEARAIREATEKERERHENAFKAFHLRWISLRKICPHEEVSYLSAAAYQSDAYECEACRAEFRDKPPQSRVV